MALSAGTRLGPFEIVALIGVGGMGEVYRAHDTKLGRDVAIKVLPPDVAADPERIARFEREARTLATLNHPHIAHIHGFEELSGPAEAGQHMSVLIMELVEGEDLSQRIRRGPIPIDEALPIAKQIAEGLEAAHEQGIVHRDLKPANIKVRDDGTVKVLDFGLAKALVQDLKASGPQDLVNSPTITSPAQMTGAGVILGTAAYMSPEQAKGRAVDRRADVWAFGAVLFEMLTAKRCFDGDDVSDTLAAILRGAPEWSALPPSTPPAIRRLLRRCLEKDIRSRLSDMAMVRVELRDATIEPDAAVAAAALAPRATIVRRMAPYVAVLVAALVTGVVVWRVRQPGDRVQPIARFSIEASPRAQLTGITRNPVTISPDGTHLVYTFDQRLYLRAVDQLEGKPITGTEPSGPLFARAPFFSPDGQSIAYWQNGQLRKIALNGGAPVTLCEINPAPIGGSWEADGRILVGRLANGIQWVPDTGGTLAPLISLKDGARAAAPQLLPGGQWLLFTLQPAGVTNEQGLAVVQSLTTAERRTLLENVREAHYVPSGHLVFGRENTLLAQPFDVDRMVVTGGPVPVLGGVSNSSTNSPAMHFAVSSTGTLFYLPGSKVLTPVTRLVHVTRDGTRTLQAEVAGMSWFPRFSPDGTRVAYATSLGADNADRADLWTLDVSRGARTRVTFNRNTGVPESENNRYYPIWTRDGARLTYAAGSGVTNRLLSTFADGSGTSETLLDVGLRWFPSSWSPDGRTLAGYFGGRTNTRDIAILQKTGDQWTSTPLIATPFEESGPIFSPSGHWLAYVSTKTGKNDVFARPYPGPGAEVTISSGGGQEPVWAPSGKELYYRNGGELLSVRIDETPASLHVGAPTRLFEDPYQRDLGGTGGGMANYDIAPDGKRFVMVEVPKSTNATESLKFNVVINWLEELKARVPVK